MIQSSNPAGKRAAADASTTYSIVQEKKSDIIRKADAVQMIP